MALPTFVDCPEQQAAIDKLIFDAYRSPKRGRGEIKRLMHKMEWTAHAIYKRGLYIGALNDAMKKQPEWSPAEDQLLRDNPERNPINLRRMLIHRGYPARTPTAIHNRRSRLHINQTEERATSGIYSCHAAAKLLGVTNHTIARYIKNGYLSAKRERGNGNNRYWIEDKQLRDLIKHHVAEIDYTKIDKFWLAEQIRG